MHGLVRGPNVVPKVHRHERQTAVAVEDDGEPVPELEFLERDRRRGRLDDGLRCAPRRWRCERAREVTGCAQTKRESRDGSSFAHGQNLKHLRRRRTAPRPSAEPTSSSTTTASGAGGRLRRALAARVRCVIAKTIEGRRAHVAARTRWIRWRRTLRSAWWWRIRRSASRRWLSTPRWRAPRWLWAARRPAGVRRPSSRRSASRLWSAAAGLRRLPRRASRWSRRSAGSAAQEE